MVTHTSPVAVQRGRTTEVTVAGQQNFQGVYRALFQGTGITAAIVATPAPPVKPPAKPVVRQARLRLTVAADAPLGVRDFRLVSSSGISSVGQLVVVDDPVLEEKEPNNTPAVANPIALPCVVCGRLQALEDVDYFKFHAEAGQTVTFEVLAARIEDRIHDLQKHADPMLTLLDAQGHELAANDDFYFADPCLSYTIPAAGDYYLQLRDSRYDGDARWVYALLATNRPYVTGVYPMAGNAGQTIEVEPVGPARARATHVSLHIPTEPGLRTVQLDVAGQKTNPTAFIVSPLPQVHEHEPNDTPAEANRITLPCGISGRIEHRGDRDHFVFAGTKGKAVRFEVKSRRAGTVLQSSLDSVLDILTPQGRLLASNDDAFGKDSALVFSPPADGDYVLRIRDLNNKGDDRAVYYIEADYARPDFTLWCDPDKAMIGPGAGAAWYVHVARLNGFTGPVRVDVKRLPAGVTASPLTIPATMTQGLVVLKGSADAPRGAADVEVVGTAVASGPDGKPTTIQRRAAAMQEIYLPGGGRGYFEVGLQSVAVTERSDIEQVEVSPHALTLRPGQEARLDVTVRRRPDYTGPVSLDVLLQHLGRVYGSPLPPGVTVVGGKSQTLLGRGSRGHIVLRAAPDAAPVENVPISVLAHVSINFVVKVSYSSPPVLLTVRR
jgi:hypothetical protein